MELINCNELWASQIEADYFVAYLNANKQRDNWHQPVSLFNIRFYGVS